MGVNAMPDETRTFENDTELARPKAAMLNRRTQTQNRQNKPALAKGEISQTREIILRLIELLKQV
jgi:hypothetical protein